MTQTMRDIATSFLDMVVSGDIKSAYSKYVSTSLVHHNAYFAAGANTLRDAMIENHSKFPNKKFAIKHVLVDGDLVAVHSHMQLTTDSAGIAVVHMFRIVNGKIVEMWDVGQVIPEVAVNKNGMF